MNTTLSSLEAVQHPTAQRLPGFCDTNRAMIARALMTQGAVLTCIQALAAQATDGAFDQAEALLHIDLVAKSAAAEAERLANMVGSLSTITL